MKDSNCKEFVYFFFCVCLCLNHTWREIFEDLSQTLVCMVSAGGLYLSVWWTVIDFQTETLSFDVLTNLQIYSRHVLCLQLADGHWLLKMGNWNKTLDFLRSDSHLLWGFQIAFRSSVIPICAFLKFHEKTWKVTIDFVFIH